MHRAMIHYITAEDVLDAMSDIDAGNTDNDSMYGNSEADESIYNDSDSDLSGSELEDNIMGSSEWSSSDSEGPEDEETTVGERECGRGRGVRGRSGARGRGGGRNTVEAGRSTGGENTDESTGNRGRGVGRGGGRGGSRGRGGGRGGGRSREKTAQPSPHTWTTVGEGMLA